MGKKPETVQEYLRNLEPDRCKALVEIRKWIKAAVPGLKETMHYGMPTYEAGNVVCAMASQKGYMSLYLDVDLVAKYKKDLGHLDCGKSCVRFKRLDDLPEPVIRRVLAETANKMPRK